jgi:predicted glutamine amidotransferase
MCQLLGMNCNVPTDIIFSFTGFHKRGGQTDHHADGWGIAFYEGRGCRLFIDTQPAVRSPVAELVRTYPIHSLNVIAHIRKATVGHVLLENTHPFVREMWGRYWTFAHNGTLKGYTSAFDAAGTRFRPVGGTDSEAAFCDLLETLWRRFPEGAPPPAALYAAIAAAAGRIAAHGDLNFLLSDGETLFARCATRLAYIVRCAPFAKAHLTDEDYSVDFNLVTTPDDRVAVIATTPLTDNEAWTPIAPGELLAFRDGVPLRVAA